jgi:hypothetical protein
VDPFRSPFVECAGRQSAKGAFLPSARTTSLGKGRHLAVPLQTSSFECKCAMVGPCRNVYMYFSFIVDYCLVLMVDPL